MEAINAEEMILKEAEREKETKRQEAIDAEEKIAQQQ